MSTRGFVTEDDLILYAMQALSVEEMHQVSARLQGDPELAGRLAEVRAVLGLYASATTELQGVPSGALDRLQKSISAEHEAHRAPVIAFPGKSRENRAQRLGLLWSGWAVAAMLLIGVGLLWQQSRRTGNDQAAEQASLRDAQSRATSLAAERDQLRNSLAHQSDQLRSSRDQASVAKSQADSLTASVAESKLRAQREAARADAISAQADQTAAERKQLSDALTHEQQLAASAAESQQVLAALADPTALHVTLTEPKAKKQPSGRGTYLASNGTLVFTGSDLSSLPADKVYELWLMPADGSAPIPAGTFTPDRSGNATVISSHFQHVEAKGFAITVERAGGSQTPTMPIVLVGLT